MRHLVAQVHHYTAARRHSGNSGVCRPEHPPPTAYWHQGRRPFFFKKDKKERHERNPAALEPWAGTVVESNANETTPFLRMARSTRFLRVRRGQGTSRQKWTNWLFHRRSSHLRLSQVLSSRYGSPQNFRLLTALDCSLKYRVPSALGLSQASQARHKIESILLHSSTVINAIARAVI